MGHVLIGTYSSGGQRIVVPHTCSGTPQQCAAAYKAQLLQSLGSDENTDPEQACQPQTSQGETRIRSWYIDNEYGVQHDVFTDNADGMTAHLAMVAATVEVLPWE